MNPVELPNLSEALQVLRDLSAALLKVSYLMGVRDGVLGACVLAAVSYALFGKRK